MLKVGDPAPDVSFTTTDDRTMRLSDLRGSNVVMYFFPKAFTPGCTREAAGFRDGSSDIEALGAQVFGVSADDHATQCDFAASVRASFPMIGDEDKRLSKAFGVLWPLIGLPRRVTFVINRDGVIRGVFQHELQVGKHLDDALAVLRSLPA